MRYGGSRLVASPGLILLTDRVIRVCVIARRGCVKNNDIPSLPFALVVN
jgi:hypothetical protein